MEKSNKKSAAQTVLTVAKWIAAVIFFLTMIALLTDKAYISAVLLLLGILLLLPPLGNFWKRKIPFLSNRFIKGGLLIVLFFVGILTNPKIGKPSIQKDDISFKRKKSLLIDYIKENSTDSSIRNIRELGKIGELFSNGNYATIHPHDGYILEDADTNASGRKLIVFNPRWDFSDATYLKDDKEKGVLSNYIIKFDIDGSGKIVFEKTIITYSKAGEVEYTSSVPDYSTFIEEKVVENQRTYLETQQILKDAEKNLAKKKEDFEENCLSSWDGSHSELVRIVKKSMNDPKSFEHDETRYKITGDYAIVIMSFRGKNAFGGTVLNSVTAKVDLSDCSVIEVE